ncbi:actin-related protein 10 [Eupeodes corollae]|uniref:actin-related protein 10 n=1 Tax=Eupeodes corollae TaxID=290404 RepID=UPI0024912116|nr:actin-related protein 10 [Eupeodes corollae]
MGIYDTVMQEKPPVVLDIGTAYTKIGFAGEAHPRFIIPSESYLSSTGDIEKLFNYSSKTELYDHMVDFLQTIFFKHVLVSPKDRKVVMVENIFGETIIRETIAEVLFKHFEVSSILFVPTHLIALSTLAVPSGVVVDMGYNEATVVPIFSSVQILKAFQDQAFGAKSIHDEIKRQLVEAGINASHLTESILEDIKVRTCFVTTAERAKQYRENQPITPPPDLEYSIKEKEIITIPGSVRETAYEIMFSEDNEQSSLPYLILDAILKCPVDARTVLGENIFLIGGTSIIMGLLSRLKTELNTLLSNNNRYKDKLFFKSVKFHTAIGRANFAAWLGASICGATEIVGTKSLTKETYAKCGHVPDWVNLDDNRLQESV